MRPRQGPLRLVLIGGGIGGLSTLIGILHHTDRAISNRTSTRLHLRLLRSVPAWHLAQIL